MSSLWLEAESTSSTAPSQSLSSPSQISAWGGFGEPFDRAESAVPLRGKVGHGPGDVVGRLFDRQPRLDHPHHALRLGALRTLTATMKTGTPGPEGSISKWEWADLNQDMTAFAADVLGVEGLAWGQEWSHRFLRSQANSIEGGTTDVLKNIVAERVLGLPRLR